MFFSLKSSALSLFSFGFLFFCVSCLTTERTCPQGTSHFEESPVVFSVQEYLTDAENRQAAAWAEYAKGYSLLLEQPESFNQAAGHFSKALSLLPDSQTIASALVGPRLLSSDLEQILQDLRPVTEANPGAPIPNMVYAECLTLLKKPEQAITHIQQTIKHNGWQDKQLVRTAAALMAEEGMPKDTENFFRKTFKQKHLRHDQIMLAIAANFWLKMAEINEKQPNEEEIEEKIEAEEKTPAEQIADTAATNGQPPETQEITAAPEEATQPESATKAEPTSEVTPDTSGSDKSDDKADTDKATAEAENAQESKEASLKRQGIFLQQARRYSPVRCRQQARSYLSQALAVPGFPDSSQHKPSWDGPHLLNQAFIRLNDEQLLDAWLAKLDGDEEQRETLPRRLLKLALLSKSQQREKLLDYLDSLHRIPFSPSHYHEEYALRQTIAEQYLQLESYDQAVQALEVIVTYYPRDLQSRLRLAHLFLYLRQPQRGLALLAPLTALPPHGWLISAQLWRQSKNYQRALDCLKQAEKAARDLPHPEGFFNTSFHTTYALVHEKLGNIDQTVSQSRLAHAQDPDDPSMCNFLGYILADHNRNLEEAESLIVKALQSEPDNTAYLDSLAWVYYRQKKFPEALSTINKTIRLGGINDDSEGVIADHAGDILAANGFIKAAKYYWLLSISINKEETEKINRKLQDGRQTEKR